MHDGRERMRQAGAASDLRGRARNDFLDLAADPEDLPARARLSAAPDLLASHELHRTGWHPPITVWPLPRGFWDKPHVATLKALTLLRGMPGFVSDLNVLDK